ncbi:hypothetical protein [Mycolicibacterium sphagni]|uniref:hypothetical protein n=1 Tax=Mycolicibacterium sphagni TaxID=1786 RepID=UPI0021F340EC|nr:hypothetical protein [Mycolicibacterium sphagni]MCV7175712.1 hypothetical protein [Mycolicibacterium sphagni]
MTEPSAWSWPAGVGLSWSGRWHTLVDQEPMPTKKETQALCGAQVYTVVGVPTRVARLAAIATGEVEAATCKKCLRAQIKANGVDISVAPPQEPASSVLADILAVITSDDVKAAKALRDQHLVNGQLLVTREQYAAICRAANTRALNLPFDYNPAIRVNSIPVVVVPEWPPLDLGDGRRAMTINGDVYVINTSQIGRPTISVVGFQYLEPPISSPTRIVGVAQ